MEIIKYSNKHKSIYQYKNQKGKFWGYRLKYKDATGKRREKKKSGFTTDAKAFEHLVEVQNDINKKNYAAVNPSSITFGEMLNIIIDEYKPNDKGVGYWSIGTYDIYRLFRDDYAKDTISHIKLSDLTGELYRKEFINKMDDVHPNTLKLYHTKANVVINEAVEREYIPRNKIKKVKLPQSPDIEEDKHMSLEELDDFLNGLENLSIKLYREKTMFYLLIYSGMRLGEARALTWSDINFNDNTIKVSKSIDSMNRMGRTKSRENRVVDVDPFVIDKLRTFKKYALKHYKNYFGWSYIFKSSKTSDPVSASSFRNHARKCAIEYIGKALSPHSFRHTHASVLLMSGQPAKVVAERLGNTEQTIIKYYSHIIPGIALSPVDAFTDKIGAKSGANRKITKLH